MAQNTAESSKSKVFQIVCFVYCEFVIECDHAHPCDPALCYCRDLGLGYCRKSCTLLRTTWSHEEQQILPVQMKQDFMRCTK